MVPLKQVSRRCPVKGCGFVAHAHARTLVEAGKRAAGELEDHQELHRLDPVEPDRPVLTPGMAEALRFMASEGSHLSVAGTNDVAHGRIAAGAADQLVELGYGTVERSFGTARRFLKITAAGRVVARRLLDEGTG